MQNDLSVTTAKIVGGHEDRIWALSATLQPFSYTENNALGDLIAVVSVIRNDDEEAAFFGKSLLDTLQNAYFAKQADTIPQALERALTQAHEAIQHERERLESATVLLGVLKDGVAYFGKIGDGTIALFRQTVLLPLVPPSPNAIITGKLEPGDYAILGTNRFFEHAYPTAEVFDGQNTANDITDILSPLLLSLPENGSIAAFIIAVANAAEKPLPQVVLAPAPEQRVSNNTPNETPQQPIEPLVVPAKSTVNPVPPSTPVAPVPPSPPAVYPTPAAPTEVAQLHQQPASQETAQSYQHPLEVAVPITPAQVPAQRTANKRVPLPKFMNQKIPAIFAGKDEELSAPQTPMGPAAPKHSFSLKKPTLFKLAFLLAVVAVCATGFIALRIFLRERSVASAASDYAQAQQLLASAQANNQSNTSLAQNYIKQAKQAIANAKKTNPQVPEPNGLDQAIADESNKVLAITAVNDPQTVVDLSLIKDGFVPDKLVYIDDMLLAVDAKTPTILSLDKDAHAGTIATGGSKLPNFISAAGFSNQILSLQQDGVSVVLGTGDTKQLIAKDSSWGNVTDIATYNGNIYVLDGAKGQVWKYPGTGSGFGTIQNVVNADSTTTATGATRFVIDGVLWLWGGNNIVRVENGTADKYTIEGLDKPLGNTIRIATSPATQNLFILDAQNQRIVVATKDGRYVNQYTSNAFKDVVDVALNDQDSKLYLLTNTKVLQIPVSL